MKRMVLILAVTLLAAGFLAAQETIKASAALPVTDGSLADKEYQLTKTFGAVTVAATLGTDKNLYLAIQTKTVGWVALGTGTGKMDGSDIFMAVVKDGKPSFTEQLGKGHSHGDSDKQLASAWKVTTVGGVTTFELVLPADKVATGAKLNLIWAFSASADLMARHSARGPWLLTVVQ